MVHPIWSTYPDIQTGLEEVKAIIKGNLSQLHPEITDRVTAYIEAPGKYLRAGLCLLFSDMSDGHLLQGKYYIAAAIEVLHLATLIHDDVIDNAATRRGLESLQVTHTNRIAIYTGDYLLAYAGRLFAKGAELLDIKEDKDRLSFQPRVIEGILVGELRQLMNQYQLSVTPRTYLKQIRGKTALLFGLATQAGAYHEGVSDYDFKTAFKIGESIGMAFQLTDDLLDFNLKSHQLGKPVLQDVQNGIYTYPIIIGLSRSEHIQHLLEEHKEKSWEEVSLRRLYHDLEQLGAFKNTEQLISRFMTRTKQYLSRLPIEKKQQEVFNHWLDEVMSRQF